MTIEQLVQALSKATQLSNTQLEERAPNLWKSLRQQAKNDVRSDTRDTYPSPQDCARGLREFLDSINSPADEAEILALLS